MSKARNDSKDRRVISYLNLRRYIGILGITLPVILVLGSLCCGNCFRIQPAISAYYHSNVGDIFVGYLSVIALFFFSYKGYPKKKKDWISDDLLGDLTCVFALGVALIPTSTGSTECIAAFDNGALGHIHIASAALFFICIAYFSYGIFTKYEGDYQDLKKSKKRQIKLHKWCGRIIFLMLVLMAIYKFSPTPDWLDDLHPIFWLETIGLWAFGISWLVKGEFLSGGKS